MSRITNLRSTVVDFCVFVWSRRLQFIGRLIVKDEK